MYDLQPAILRTNKQINKESRRVLYNENLFVLVKYPQGFGLDEVLTQDLTLLAAKEDDVRCFRSDLLISLHVDLCLPGIESQIVIAANELPVFCRLLKRFDDKISGFLSRLILSLGVFPSYTLDVDASAHMRKSSRVSWKPRPLLQQRKLLEPFAGLHSMTNLKIADMDGKTQYINVKLVEDVKKRASRAPYIMEEVLDISAKINEKGNEAFRAGDFALAQSLYESALVAREDGSRYLEEGELAGQTHLLQATGLLGFRIGSNLVAALLRLQQWTAAHEKATTVINMVEKIGKNIVFEPGALAKLYHRRALASQGMGKMARAVKEIQEALSFDPKNTQMKAKLKEWKLQSKDPNQVQAALKALTM